MRIAFVLLVSVMFAPSSWAQRLVTGQVFGYNERPAAGVTVRLSARDYTVMTVTDAHGHFRLAGFPHRDRFEIAAWNSEGHANGVLGMVYMSAATRVRMRLEAYVTEGSCGYVYAWRDATPGLFVYPAEPAWIPIYCL